MSSILGEGDCRLSATEDVERRSCYFGTLVATEDTEALFLLRRCSIPRCNSGRGKGFRTLTRSPFRRDAQSESMLIRRLRIDNHCAQSSDRKNVGLGHLDLTFEP